MTRDLVHLVRAGDIAAFEEVFRAFHTPLCEVVDSYVRSQAVAEEIVQDLFLVIWIKRTELPAKSLRQYLFGAARNRALHHLRHRSVVRRWSLRVEARPEVAGIAPPSPLPDRAIEERERGAALRRAIDQLPPRTRLALVLQWEHRMSQGEIAEAMGISIKGVEKLIATAKLKLRAYLPDHDDAAWLPNDGAR
jgi:RNA polymerase sigma-70 factor (ECF subfamily)